MFLSSPMLLSAEEDVAERDGMGGLGFAETKLKAGFISKLGLSEHLADQG